MEFRRVLFRSARRSVAPPRPPWVTAGISQPCYFLPNGTQRIVNRCQPAGHAGLNGTPVGAGLGGGYANVVEVLYSCGGCRLSLSFCGSCPGRAEIGRASCRERVCPYV